MKLLISFITVILLTAINGSVQAKSFLWQIKNDSAVVYLFGSIHLAKASMYPLDPAVEQAFSATEKLVVEVNQAESDKVKVQNILLTKGMYSGEDTLADNLDTQTLSLLQDYLKRHQLSYMSIAKLRPTMAAITITVMRMMQLGFSPEMGIDMHFIKKAQHQHKPILQLETEEEQLNLLLDIPDENLFLRYSLSSLSGMEDTLQELVNAWKTGNTAKMNQLMLEEPLNEYPIFESLFNKLFVERNIKMTKKIKDYLNTKNTYFVVVGAGHMVGEKGIVRLLQKAGYTIEQL